MGTAAIIYFNGELLCYTSYDGSPTKLGEGLHQIRNDWRDILQICEPYKIFTVGLMFWLKDPEFVYTCFPEERKSADFKELLSPEIQKELKENINAVSDLALEEVVFEPFNELYHFPFYADEEYQYNHTEKGVFVRLGYKNFPWIAFNDLNPFNYDEYLIDILCDMAGVIELSEFNEKLNSTLHLDGPVSSGRHFNLACKKATQYLPNDPNSWWNYGVSLELINKFQEAIEAYSKAKNLTPNHPIIWGLLGNVYFKDRKVEESKSCLRKSYENLYRLESFNEVEKERQKLILISNKLNDQKFLDDFYNNLIRFYCSLELELKGHLKRKIWLPLAELYYNSNNIVSSKEVFKKEITYILNKIDLESNYWYYLFQNNKENLVKKVEELKDDSIVDFISKEFSDAFKQLYIKYPEDPYLNFLYGQELFYQGETEVGL
ncbi:MAG: tetratricopeptide repeat protein, partial [Candidatus Thorarchaeota archaeon]